MNPRQTKILILFLLIICSVTASCTQKEKYQRSEGMIWNTVYHIIFKGPQHFRDSILPVLNEVGKSLSVFDKSSLVSSLNSSDSVKADIHLLKVYDSSQEINLLSKGNFDPTVSPLVNAWGFGLGHEATADTLAVDSILQFVGIGKTYKRNGFIIKEDVRTQFNFSAIAKGYGCDAVGEMFSRNGIKDYMVEIGGELSLSGKSPSGSDWRIAVDAPLEDINPGEEAAVIISLTDKGVATSGNYRNYRMEGSSKVAHTISPVSGRPVLSPILSATVIADNCMKADALATACMAGSFEEAKEIIKESGAQALLIFSDSLWMSPGFKKYVTTEVSEP